MKTVLFLSTLLVGAQSFVPVAPARQTVQLNKQVAEEDMDADRLTILGYQQKWSEIRHMDRDEAQKTLDGEWLEAYNRFYEKYDDDMVRMAEIAEKVQKMIEPPKVEKKSKGQKRRDAMVRKAERAGSTV
eukprot:CAMPEP_0117027726 /NCGR_PEP_ID=MMETSP0472-20121206/20235_1 /TAXON_ID=693140 ORGANISM="Tiarina fusus, Strain LIS" /NCGR_SAMPLE_ID=MMETSP0472 /ASSEMBLY_ACC=CAM_ASM_000603 /LENGTH=129 /DNA_ID=CAMNT_0004735041 /DNA_START=65 /DNA_END=454 /DNA_ORIENTATION=-